MGGKKKDAKTAHRQSAQAAVTVDAPKQVMLAGIHLVNSTLSPKTACGEWRTSGWRYGELSSVRCSTCKGESDGEAGS